MSKHPVYGLLYIILLPFAFLLGLSALFYLLLATQAPAFLIMAFITSCFTIYTVATLVFYIKAIQQEKECKPGLRDWIRVNAFVIIIPAIFLLVIGVTVMIKPGLVNLALQQLQTMQDEKLPYTANAVRLSFCVSGVYMAAMLVHIIYTFRLLGIYRNAFGYGKADIEQ